MVTIYGLIELTNGVLGTQAGIAHFAHLGGMLGAYLVLRLSRAPPKARTLVTPGRRFYRAFP